MPVSQASHSEAVKLLSKGSNGQQNSPLDSSQNSAPCVGWATINHQNFSSPGTITPTWHYHPVSFLDALKFPIARGIFSADLFEKDSSFLLPEGFELLKKIYTFYQDTGASMVLVVAHESKHDTKDRREAIINSRLDAMADLLNRNVPNLTQRFLSFEDGLEHEYIKHFLSARDFYIGEINGEENEEYKEALGNFQKENQLEVTNSLNEETIQTVYEVLFDEAGIKEAMPHDLFPAGTEHKSLNEEEAVAEAFIWTKFVTPSPVEYESDAGKTYQEWRDAVTLDLRTDADQFDADHFPIKIVYADSEGLEKEEVPPGVRWVVYWLYAEDDTDNTKLDTDTNHIENELLLPQGIAPMINGEIFPMRALSNAFLGADINAGTFWNMKVGNKPPHPFVFGKLENIEASEHWPADMLGITKLDKKIKPELFVDTFRKEYVKTTINKYQRKILLNGIKKKDYKKTEWGNYADCKNPQKFELGRKYGFFLLPPDMGP